MAFLPPEQQNQNAPQGQTMGAGTAGAPPQTGGSAGAGSGASKASGEPSSQGTPTQFGSSSSKLGDYLSANAPQIQNQANTITGNLNTQYGQIQGDITNAANQFGQQVQGGYDAPNPDLINSAIQNTTGFVTDPNNIKAFQGQYNDTYTGPQNYESTTPYAGIQNEVSSAVQNAGLLGSQAGLTSYLAGQGGPNQTRASNTLDALLLQGNPAAQQQIQQAAGQFKGLTDQFGKSVTGADQSVQAAQQAAQQAQAYAQGQFNPYIQNFGNQITQGAQQAEAQRQAYNNSLNQFYSQATPVEQQINQWAGTLPGSTGQSVTDLFAPVISGNKQIANPITAQNFATPEQYQQAAAIQQLLGNAGNLPISADTASLAGTAPNVSQANLPTLQNILQQYEPLISGAYNTANQASGAGTPGQANVFNSTKNLVQYLSGLDPANYTVYNTGGLNGFGFGA